MPIEPIHVGLVLDGRYRLDAPIGQGGMATVWRAQHLTLQRSVAIKLIEVSSRAQHDQFQREARVAAAVRHPNVVSITDFGASGARAFLVMELLEGQSLGARLEEPYGLELPDVIRLISKVLSGLAAVHAAGIVHRDLKPENIFLARDADGEFPKLMDFGVSRALAADLESAMPTLDGVVAGTPQYMSPEQARSSRDLDHRSDLFSLGTILYELLSGRLPFGGAGAGDVLVAVATRDPVPLATLRPDLGEPLIAVVERALKRDPNERFADAREMRKALLEAAAKTAAALSGRGGAPIALGVDSVLPMIEPRALYAAIGDAFEPGDAGVIALSEDDLVEIHAPPADPDTEPQRAPPERAMAETVVSRPARRRGLVAALAACGLCGLLAVPLGWWVLASDAPAASAAASLDAPGDDAPVASPAAASAPPEEIASEGTGPAVREVAPPEEGTVTVTLRGVPPDAWVFVDHTRVGEGPIELRREYADIPIEVRLAGHRPWRVTHVATEDGTYDVRLQSAGRRAPSPRPAPARARPSSRGNPTAPTARRAPGLFGDPGF